MKVDIPPSCFLQPSMKNASVNQQYLEGKPAHISEKHKGKTTCGWILSRISTRGHAPVKP